MKQERTKPNQDKMTISKNLNSACSSAKLKGVTAEDRRKLRIPSYSYILP